MKSLSDKSDTPFIPKPDTADPARKAGFLGLTIGAVGVVFGDIGTSPLYAMREALHHSRAGTAPELAAFGVISLVFWALLLLVTIKYVIFLMRADNHGEGGTLVLMGLAQKALGKPSQAIFLLGLCGAALFYGDSLITPAVSVLGALEGLKDAPGIGGGLDQYILPLSLVILLGLFLVQSKGTEKVARFFGPVMLVWFTALGALGLYWIAQRPEILQALSPHYGVSFLLANGLTGFVVLGSVFLVVTGAEALYADMGHFGRGPIGAAWLWVAFPALIINYLGQGALTIIEPSAVENPFWRMVPELAYWPMLLLACAATVIASQAVISGAFSITQHAVQMGILPRMVIKRTSETQEGQIYVPQMNWLLMIGVVVLVVTFQTSGNLTSAYGIAVTGTMLISSVMAYVVMRRLWNWSRLRTLALLVPLGLLELVFLTSNLTKLFSGAWMPLLLGVALILVMVTWTKGTRIIAAKTHRESLPIGDVAAMLETRPPLRVPGTAVFLTADATMAPTSLMHNLKHNRVLHENNVVLSVQIANVPHVGDDGRIGIERINEDFTRVTLTFGFMDMPNVPRALGLCRKRGLKFDAMTTTFFVGRRTLVATPHGGMPLWQDLLFIVLMKNAADPSEFFRLPPGRVVEMGTQMRV
ncbi:MULTISPECIES: potassium transporter Kup [Asticcacaulis]|uniref:potassium transporter Kup n=1 Tax=Asticcacaulis TaxID=76890 RepID=UPI001AE115DD|nr:MULTISPECIES: potassium transporter Kup [Asticcacaulis]MBP2160334.1 KUP system potassium uptake protein [Asticcacaulis solisilvae]MDR6801363.1 KUP system potassium uptake protein [Asticcacaulis sp. BE141]